ncbi:MAG: hypothetical protein D4R64_09075 [Porphyromonadaceae bacterium]|nr:MAG: hypothetical protein D4R64_09075 [Porphyromonadaceae bacterium]
MRILKERRFSQIFLIRVYPRWNIRVRQAKRFRFQSRQAEEQYSVGDPGRFASIRAIRFVVQRTIYWPFHCSDQMSDELVKKPSFMYHGNK